MKRTTATQRNLRRAALALVLVVVCAAIGTLWVHQRSTRMRMLLPSERSHIETSSTLMRARVTSQLNQFREAVRTGFRDHHLLPICSPDSGGHNPDWVPAVVRIDASRIDEITPASYVTRSISPREIDRRIAESRRPMRSVAIAPSIRWFDENPPPLGDQAVFIVSDTVSPMANGDATPGALTGTVLLFDALAQRCVCASSLTVTNSAEMRARLSHGASQTELRRDLDDRVPAAVRGVFERQVPN